MLAGLLLSSLALTGVILNASKISPRMDTPAPAHRTGHGSLGIYSNLAQCKTPEECLDRIARTDRRHTVPDQSGSRILARILPHHRIIIVSDLIHEYF